MAFGPMDTQRLGRFHAGVTVLAAGGMFINGFELTVIAVALPLVVPLWHVGAAMEGIVAAAALAGALVGALIAGPAADRFGRRPLFVAELALLVGFSAATALAQTPAQLAVYRFLLGLGIGADYLIAPTLVSEFSPARQRGALVTAVAGTWFVGSVFAYLAGFWMLPLGPSAWRWLMAVGGLLAPWVMLPRLRLPESPRWLAARGRGAEAAAVVERLTGERPAAAPPSRGRFRDLFGPDLIGPTVFVSTFWFCYDVAAYGISTYTPLLLRAFPGGSLAHADLGAAAVGVTGIAGAALGLALVDRWGRRPLIVSTFLVLSLSLLALSLAPSPAFAVLVVLFAVASLAATMGPGVVSLVYATELFPSRLRGSATGFATAVSRAGGILGIVVFPPLLAAWGLGPALWLFTGASLVGLGVSVRMAPETRGRTLESIAG